MFFTLSIRILWRPKNARLSKEVFKFFPNPQTTSGQRNAIILTESLHVIVVSSLFVAKNQVHMPTLFLLFLSFSFCYFSLAVFWIITWEYRFKIAAQE